MNEQPSVVITGAGGGLGRAVSERLARRGAKLHLVGRDKARLERVEVEAKRLRAQVTSYQADFRQDEQLVNLADQLRAAESTVDLLIHCAGVHHLGEVADTPLAIFDELMAVNIRAPFLLTQLLLPNIIAAAGQIVFVNSSAGLQARAGAGVYAASKWALRGLADGLRAEVNPLGVRVLSVFPGRIATPMQERIHELEGLPYDSTRLLSASDVGNFLVHLLELPRTAEVTDISIRHAHKLAGSG